jgi:hypothetical protein
MWTLDNETLQHPNTAFLKAAVTEEPLRKFHQTIHRINSRDVNPLTPNDL